MKWLRVAASTILAVAMTACSSSGGPDHPGSRVSVWGDSLSVQANDALVAQGRGHGLNLTVIGYFGLAPCDVAKEVLHDIATSPDALVLAFSGNNFSPCMEKQGKQLTGAAYYAKYRRDIGAFIAAATAKKVPVLVVGPPAFPAHENIPDRVELNAVLREVVAAHPGSRYVASAPFVSPNGFTRTLPCAAGETAALGCHGGTITVRSGTGVHFDEPRAVPCPDGDDGCSYTAGGHRFANAVMTGLAKFDQLSYRPAAPTVGVPAQGL